MPKRPMRDVVILIPGIGGSVLQYEGRDVWALSGESITQFLSRSLPWAEQGSLERLLLNGDDPAAADVGDRVEASRVLPRQQLVPGLQKHSGYRAVADWVSATFDVIERDVSDPRPGNLYEWPYDWRRDLRSSARKLERFISDRLTAWGDVVENQRVVILAHSMGGLVARYYTEVLGGWTQCRALVTFGTPHRGSVKAVDVLANGYLGNLAGIGDLMRSCTSVYQLLPRYQMLEVGGDWLRPGETDGIPGIDPEKAADALAFYREMDAAAERNRTENDYDGFAKIAVAGTEQRTVQSARWDGQRLMTDRGSSWHPRRLLGDVRRVPLPPGVDPVLDGGDGTVPYVAAVPIELSGEPGLITTVIEGHGSLQRAGILDAHLRDRLVLTQAKGLADLRGETSTTSRGLALDVEDLYPRSEPVVLGARTVNLDEDPGSITARIRHVESGDEIVMAGFEPRDGEWHATLNGLVAGLYEAEITAGAARFVPAPVHTLFEVTE